jgi:FtsZ-binding cell division protein ZapB
MKALESILAEHEQMKRELTELREHIESPRPEGFPRPTDPENNRDIGGRVSPVAAMLELQEEHQDRGGAQEHELDMDDDRMSTASNDTLTWKASPPNNNKSSYHPQKPNQAASSPPPLPPSAVDPKQLESIIEQNHLLSERIESISASLEDTAHLGESLMEQHKQSSHIITCLQKEIEELKQKLPAPQQPQPQHPNLESAGSIETLLAEKVEKQYSIWTDRLESGWKQQQASWESERASLQKMIHELEARLHKQDHEHQQQQSRLAYPVDDAKQHQAHEDIKPAPQTSSTSISKSSKRNRKKKTSQSSILSSEADASSPSTTATRAEHGSPTLPSAGKPDPSSALSSLFTHPSADKKPGLEAARQPHSSQDHPASSASSPDHKFPGSSSSPSNNPPMTNGNARPFMDVRRSLSSCPSAVSIYYTPPTLTLFSPSLA